MRVEVYRNLRRSCWSIRAVEGPHKGRVVAHAARVQLRDVSARVSEAGRRRVLRERRKNVHAFLIGDLVSFDRHRTTRGRWSPALVEAPCFTDLVGAYRAQVNGSRITYNPYKSGGFYLRDADAEGVTVPVHEAEEACLLAGDVWAILP